MQKTQRQQQVLQGQFKDLQLNQPHQQEEEQQQQEGQGSKWQKIEMPQKQVPLFMVDFDHCDAKKCTGKKMERFKLLTRIRDHKKKFRGIVLSAFGKKYISTADLQTVQKHGICVIDCSWNRIEQTRQFRYKHQRKLPFVVAGNPVNYGKPYQLSCVQALTTGLCAVGYFQQAKYIISKFGWAQGFWQMNKDIQRYGSCGSLQEMEKESKRIQEGREQGFVRNYQMPDSDQEEEQEQGGKQEKKEEQR